MVHVNSIDLSRIAVAIPARDEAAHIAGCLHALNRQVAAAARDIVVLVNNSTDRTAAIARSFRTRPETAVHVVERTWSPSHANAGNARRRAMQIASRYAGPRGILLTTDADSAADPDWLAANVAALSAGADAVAGWVELDPTDWSRIPLALHQADARECAYDLACDEIASLLDPDDADPWPRHTQHSGASIAVTAAAFGATGGIPPVASGEDRAFFAALRRVGARIRHAPECRVVVSGRTEGRAAGGMAETIRRRMVMPDDYLDDRLEPAGTCAYRAAMRRRLRACLGDPAAMAAYLCDVRLPGLELPDACFSEAWDAIEAQSPMLLRQRVAVSQLPAEMARAQAIRAGLIEKRRDPGHAGRAAAVVGARSSSLV